ELKSWRLSAPESDGLTDTRDQGWVLLSMCGTHPVHQWKAEPHSASENSLCPGYWPLRVHRRRHAIVVALVVVRTPLVHVANHIECSKRRRAQRFATHRLGTQRG